MDLITVRQNEMKLYNPSHAAEVCANVFGKRASDEIPSIEER